MQGLTVKQRMIKIHFNARATFNSVCASTKTAHTIPAYLPNSSQSNTTWWRHQMEIYSALLALCAGNSQRPVTRSFGVFFYLRLNRRLSKQSWGWRFKMLSRPLWRHSNNQLTCHCALLIDGKGKSLRFITTPYKPDRPGALGIYSLRNLIPLRFYYLDTFPWHEIHSGTSYIHMGNTVSDHSFPNTYMQWECTIVLGKNEALLKTWKQSKHKYKAVLCCEISRFLQIHILKEKYNRALKSSSLRQNGGYIILQTLRKLVSFYT